jgi:hypothetical protein
VPCRGENHQHSADCFWFTIIWSVALWTSQKRGLRTENIWLTPTSETFGEFETWQLKLFADPLLVVLSSRGWLLEHTTRDFAPAVKNAQNKHAIVDFDITIENNIGMRDADPNASP